MILTGTHEDLQQSGPALSYLRTVDRSLLHRRALSEVFLTDSRQLGEFHYVSAAQLPPAHAYYTDHIDAEGGGSIYVDPLLVLECCRQAETYGGHAYFGVKRDVRFIARSWAMDLPRLGEITAAGPVELIIDATVGGRRGAPDRPTGLSYAMRVYATGTLLGTVTIDVGYLSPNAYDRLRATRRGSTPHLAITGPAATALSARPVPSASVGRTDPRNVVLTDPVFRDLSVRAAVRVPLENPSLFDHPLDHLPGMVLMEAARQACQLTAASVSQVAPGQVTVMGADMVFSSWAELDQLVTVQAALDSADRTGRWRAAVAFEQRGAVIASGTMTVSTR